MFKYNKNRGCSPVIGDVVKIIHTDSDLDYTRGELAGFSDFSKLIGIIILEQPYNGCKAITMPIVCLDLV